MKISRALFAAGVVCMSPLLALAGDEIDDHLVYDSADRGAPKDGDEQDSLPEAIESAGGEDLPDSLADFADAVDDDVAGPAIHLGDPNEEPDASRVSEEIEPGDGEEIPVYSAGSGVEDAQYGGEEKAYPEIYAANENLAEQIFGESKEQNEHVEGGDAAEEVQTPEAAEEEESESELVEEWKSWDVPQAAAFLDVGVDADEAAIKKAYNSRLLEKNHVTIDEFKMMNHAKFLLTGKKVELKYNGPNKSKPTKSEWAEAIDRARRAARCEEKGMLLNLPVGWEKWEKAQAAEFLNVDMDADAATVNKAYRAMLLANKYNFDLNVDMDADTATVHNFELTRLLLFKILCRARSLITGEQVELEDYYDVPPEGIEDVQVWRSDKAWEEARRNEMSKVDAEAYEQLLEKGRQEREEAELEEQREAVRPALEKIAEYSTYAAGGELYTQFGLRFPISFKETMAAAVAHLKYEDGKMDMPAFRKWAIRVTQRHHATRKELKKVTDGCVVDFKAQLIGAAELRKNSPEELVTELDTKLALVVDKPLFGGRLLRMIAKTLRRVISVVRPRFFGRIVPRFGRKFFSLTLRRFWKVIKQYNGAVPSLAENIVFNAHTEVSIDKRVELASRLAYGFYSIGYETVVADAAYAFLTDKSARDKKELKNRIDTLKLIADRIDATIDATKMKFTAKDDEYVRAILEKFSN